MDIRNICIVAHVDHGKTSLSDGLIASTGLFSKRLAARIRYLDSRDDEQIRGITMMSSAIALEFTTRGPQGPVKTVINLIDSPGHIDFSSEVSTASRLSDSALVVVDVVEGVCSQTRNVLRQAWIDNLKPLLVLNKLDRLIVELQLSPQDAYLRLMEVINQVNAVTASFYQGDVINAHANNIENIKDDSNIYFSPQNDNVVFTCAYDGWGFNLKQFAHIIAQKLGDKFTPEDVHSKLWEGYYFDAKLMDILPIPQNKKSSNKKPLFVSFILDSIWKLYHTILDIPENPDSLETLKKMVSKMNINVPARDLQAKQKDSKALIQIVLSQFLPLANSLLGAVINILPSPVEAQKTRIPKLIESSAHNNLLDTKLADEMTNCDSKGHISGFVAKLVSLPKDIIEMANKQREIDQSDDAVDDIMERARRLRALASTQSRPLKKKTEDENQEETPKTETFTVLTANDNATTADDDNDNSDDSDDYDPFEYEEEEPEEESEPEEEEEEELEAFIAFTRLYSGSISIGDEVVVLSPLYDPERDGDKAFPLLSNESDQHTATKIKVDGIFQFKGRELVSLTEASAGMVIGIQSNAFNYLMLKTATIADPRLFPDTGSNGMMISLTHEASHLNLPPLLHSTLEPTNFRDLNKLIRGIKRLNLSDPNVRGYVNENGEVILETSGELHLERCVKDLKERFANVDMSVGRARVGFRETITKEMEGVIKVTNGDVKIKLKPYKDDGKDTALEIISKSDKFNAILTKNPQLDTSEIDIGAIAMGFSIAVKEGPMMAEPMDSLDIEILEITPTTEVLDNVIGDTKSAIHDLFLLANPRIELAMYKATIQTTPDLLGKVYPVISKAKGKITLEEMKEGTPWFIIEATMPVMTTFGFSEQIRKDTSGGAIATLEFLGFEVLEEDPFWVPQTEEEMEEFGDNIKSAEGRGWAKAILQDVRKSKGLSTEQKVVENAEKQRTLKR